MKFNLKKIVSMATMIAILAASTVILQADATAITVPYLKYVYDDNNSQPEPYNLVLEENTSISTRDTGVIGTDDRELDVNDGLVFLYTEEADLGTGFIVGDHVIATAAHCVFAYDDSNHASTYYFIPGMKINMYHENGAKYGEELTPVEVHIPAAYDNASVAVRHEYDYALITVEEDLSAFTHFKLGYEYDTNHSNSTNIPIFQSGYPRTVKGVANTNKKLYTGSGYIYSPPASLNPLPHLLYHIADLSDDNSGGPVYTITQYTVGSSNYYVYTAISLASRSSSTCNWGPRFDSPIIQFYITNNYIEY